MKNAPPETEGPRPRKTKYTQKEKRDVVALICEHYATAKHTIVSLVYWAGIAPPTFYRWVKADEKLSALWKDAQQECFENSKGVLVPYAYEGLIKLLRGHTVRLHKTTYDKPDGDVISHVETDVYNPPNPSAVLKVLSTNAPELMPEQKDIQEQEQQDIPDIVVNFPVEPTPQNERDQTGEEQKQG